MQIFRFVFSGQLSVETWEIDRVLLPGPIVVEVILICPFGITNYATND